ncbi:putative metalloprotease CJM1_0395 family protein [Geothrix sp. 21YS21S-2]|uniref:putative metalloprotease CJM1_0395 family protein n=1 Tax=Geothrix sp. 21YS21S-2 TaxID=3068893 RepID=UPI0027B96B0B|nr:putative metalloprotease CJM1_0395 family protein [Geothrix sp. 21YS21S-2]
MADGVPSISSSPPAPDPSRAGQAAPVKPGDSGTTAPTGGSAPRKAARSGADTLNLSPEAKAQVAKLQARDAAVKAHEAAHIAAGAGVVTSGASYSYQRGPDGRNYAVGGEVSVDTSPVKDNPQATIAKASRIMASALAPADPSGQDRSVAAAAAAMASQAAAELASKGSKAAAPQAGTGQKSYGEAATKGETPGGLVDTVA